MRKKVITIALAMLCSVAFVCYASDSASKEIAVGDSFHTISFERLDKDPPLFVAKDIIVVPGKDIAHFSISATLAENHMLKSLIVDVVSSQAFAATGEFEWIFPSGKQLNMYGKTVARADKNGMTEYTITFLSGLPDFYACSSSVTDCNVFLKIYFKKGAAKEVEIPSAFFALLLESKK